MMRMMNTIGCCVYSTLFTELMYALTESRLLHSSHFAQQASLFHAVAACMKFHVVVTLDLTLLFQLGNLRLFYGNIAGVAFASHGPLYGLPAGTCQRCSQHDALRAIKA